MKPDLTPQTVLHTVFAVGRSNLPHQLTYMFKLNTFVRTEREKTWKRLKEYSKKAINVILQYCIVSSSLLNGMQVQESLILSNSLPVLMLQKQWE